MKLPLVILLALGLLMTREALSQLSICGVERGVSHDYCQGKAQVCLEHFSIPLMFVPKDCHSIQSTEKNRAQELGDCVCAGYVFDGAEVTD